MDWTRAIDRNQTALARIVAALFAMVGLVPGGSMEKPPNAVRLAVLRILRQAESAVRRLIVIAAHGLEVKLPPPRPMPAGLKIPAKGPGTAGARTPAFQLFDPRKRFDLSGRRRGKARPRPRITFFTFDDVNGVDDDYEFDDIGQRPAPFLRPAPAPVVAVPPVPEATPKSAAPPSAAVSRRSMRRSRTSRNRGSASRAGGRGGRA